MSGQGPGGLVEFLERERFVIELKEPDADGRRVAPIQANVFQRRLDASLAAGHRWHVILKPRQVGISTYVLLRFLAKCLLVEGTKAAIVSHEHQATVRLLRRIHLALDDLLKRKAVIGGKPVETEYSSTKEITFPHLNSSLYIGTAGKRAFSRGDALTDFHGSEVAFWPDASTLMTGVIGALVPSAEVFLESTANGMGGYFYEQVEKCGAGEGVGQLHFFPWHEFPEYQADVREGTAWSPAELQLQARFSLTDRQLAWRRAKLGKYDKLELFTQEFPLTIEEAFIVAGACWFDKASLKDEAGRAEEPRLRALVESVGSRAVLKPLGATDRADYAVEVHEHPRAGEAYLISVDTSEGVEDGDPMAALVLHRERLTEAAWLHGRLDPPEAARALYALGQLYGWAWLAVEDNNTGLAVLMELKRLGYPRLYQRRDLEGDGDEKPRLGWRTDRRTRTVILSALRSAMKTRAFRPRSAAFYRECSTFCRQNDGGYRANAGAHDDRVMASAIGVFLNQQLPLDPRPEDEVRGGGYTLYGAHGEQLRRGHKTGY